MDDLDGLYHDPNGPAYVTREERVGPPLEYVQGKLTHALEALHALHAVLRAHPSSATAPPRDPATAEPLADPGARQAGQVADRVRSAFHYALVAYLGLSNMLALANERALEERLLALDDDEFRDWPQRIERGGSVTG